MKNPYYPFTKFETVQTYNFLERAFQWRLDDLFRDSGPFNFYLEVAETYDFSEIIYTIDAGNSFYVIDDSKKYQSLIPTFCYRVKLTTGSGKIYYSQVLKVNVHPEKDWKYQLAKEITRKEFVRMRYTGSKGWVLKRKNYGEINSSDVDPISGVPLVMNNPDIGTGLSGGYHKPLRITYTHEECDTQVELSQQGYGVQEIQTIDIRMVGFPLVMPYDVIVTDENTRFVIRRLKEVHMPGTSITLIQQAHCILIPLNDPIYNIKMV